MGEPRTTVRKTMKLLIGGAFPRSESGRTRPILTPGGELLAHVPRASRKDLREAVEAARAAFPKWASVSPLLRGQILYRLAEMTEGKRVELAEAIRSAGGDDADAEVSATVDRLVHYAGWADKVAQILGCQNPVGGPYHNFTTPEPVGVVCVIAPPRAPLLSLVSLVAPVVASGNACVALVSSASPIPGLVWAEGVATSDLPGGVINLLSGEVSELASWVARHREIDALHVSGATSKDELTLREGAAENLKRVVIRPSPLNWDDATCQGLAWIEPFLEMKTIWHPIGA